MQSLLDGSAVRHCSAGSIIYPRFPGRFSGTAVRLMRPFG
jgi:hypothetical protein